MLVRARTLVITHTGSEVWRAAADLDSQGFPTIFAETPAAGMAVASDLRIDAAIIDCDDPNIDPVMVASSIRAQCLTRLIPVLAIGPRERVMGVDLGPASGALVTPFHTSQISQRIRSLLRLSVIEREARLRMETFAERGATFNLPGLEIYDRPVEVLFVGDASPWFMMLNTALENAGARTVATFSSYTAFDYMHERDFDAVVLGAGAEPVRAFGVVAGMRRNTRHNHVPALLLAEPGFDDYDGAYEREVNDILPFDTALEDVKARIFELAHDSRRRAALKTAFERGRAPGLMDAGTGLFTRDVFASHLLRLVRAARSEQQTLSIAAMRISESPDVARARQSGALDRAIPQIGSMLGRLVRAEDTAGRLSVEVFAMAFPSTPLVSARLTADRIASVIGCTAFDGGMEKPPFQVQFHAGVAELLPSETAEMFLSRALANLERRAVG